MTYRFVYGNLYVHPWQWNFPMSEFTAKFKYCSRGYTAIERDGVVTIIKHATKRFYESEPMGLNLFIPRVQTLALEALTKVKAKRV